jgi:hypothetical protein
MGKLSRTFQWNKFSIWQIRRHAIDSLYLDENGEGHKKWIVNLYFHFFPLFCSLSLLGLGVFMSDDVSNYLITGVSIFAGLFFNLLLIIADKLKIRKEVLSSVKTEAKENYLKRFEIFSSQFISTISYAIVQSIWLILLILLCKINVFEADVEQITFLYYFIW